MTKFTPTMWKNIDPEVRAEVIRTILTGNRRSPMMGEGTLQERIAASNALRQANELAADILFSHDGGMSLTDQVERRIRRLMKTSNQRRFWWATFESLGSKKDIMNAFKELDRRGVAVLEVAILIDGGNLTYWTGHYSEWRDHIPAGYTAKGVKKDTFLTPKEDRL